MGNFLTPDAYVKSIYAIKPERLQANQIKGLILDIDNTLVPTKTKDPDEKVIDFISKLLNSGLKAIIVSNAKKERVERFSKPLGIEYIYKALKPFGRGYRKAIEKMGLKPEQVAIVGDQLFTDIIGGNFMGINTILISPLDPDEPMLIKFKRIFERPFVKGKTFRDEY